MPAKQNVQTVGEAITVLVQVAELAQSRGILSFDDSIITKSAIDFLMAMSQPMETEENNEGPEA